MFQVPDAAGDPFTRWPAIYSLICALMSLTYGCIYIVQFGTMRSMYKASRWAEVCEILIMLSFGIERLINHTGGPENENCYLVERVGFACHAGNMACLVNDSFLGSHHGIRLAYGC